jgi:hypothetical protein
VRPEKSSAHFICIQSACASSQRPSPSFHFKRSEREVNAPDTLLDCVALEGLVVEDIDARERSMEVKVKFVLIH